MTTPLAAEVRVELIAPPRPPTAAIEAEVERIWSAARAAVPALFDGRVFSAHEIGTTRITGWWTAYRYALAQIRQPELYENLRVRSLAVNGVVHGPDGIVFGRRHDAAIYQAGMWQCPPAGSVEARHGDAPGIDLVAQVTAELVEELGMPADAIDTAHTLAAVEHPGSHVVDVGIALATGLRAEAIERAHRACGNAEYSELRIVAIDELAAAMRDWNDMIVPPARVFVGMMFPTMRLD